MISGKPLSNEDKKMLQYFDNKDYQSKFLLSPDIKSEADYIHLDKNLAITNLKHNPKLAINEPEEARAILRALHVLNNPKYYHQEEKKVLIGYREEQTEEGILQTPVFRKELMDVPNFPKSFHNLKSEFISLTNTSAARGGHRIKAATTNRLVKEETLIDKSEVKNRWFTGKNKQPQNY